MFTDCPGCTRQFRVRAAQLAAVKGQVKCGYCGKQFNALESLRDKPRPAQDLPEPARGKAQHTAPEFEIPGAGNAVIASKQAPAKQDIEQEKSAAAKAAITHEAAVGTSADYVLLEDLLAPEALGPGRFSKLFWIFLISLLLLAATQLAWFNRDPLLSRYPELIPYARQLCERMPCQWIRYHNVGEIKLLNRDVREHPRYEGALLVNATLVNQAKVIQPFPRIQFGLFDINGKLLAYREFSSDDYLDESINVDNGMAPDEPIHIVLEVIGSTVQAVGFEFRFL